MNDTRNRDKPAREMTKRELAALELYAHNHEMTAGAAVRCADALFDALDHVPELAHAYDEPDFDHESTP